jgi:copper homeostasis protein
MQVEICLDSGGTGRQLEQDLEAVVAGGARRVELCLQPALGGLSPEPGQIRRARTVLQQQVEIGVLLRPRTGHFHYDTRECRTVLRGLGRAAESGADFAVLGALRPGPCGTEPDRPTLARWFRECHTLGLAITFHRAFDELDRPWQALEWLIDQGVQRVLSGGAPGGYHPGDGSGHPPSAAERQVRLEGLLQKAGTRIEVVVGGGIGPGTAPELVRALARRGGLWSLHSHSAVLARGQVSRARVARLVGLATRAGR